MTDVPKLQCAICGSTDGIKKYAVTVDGEPLELAPWLCKDHGEAFIFGHGILLGCLERSMAGVFACVK